MGDIGLFLIGESSAEIAGRVTGQAFVWVLLLAGAWKCFSISRRPTTNTKCALALMFMLLVVGIASALGTLIKMDERPQWMIIGAGVGALLLFGLQIAALVLAILGLVEISKQPGRFRQGQAQAIWALVLVGLFGTTIGIGFVKGLMRRMEPDRTVEVATEPGKALVFEEQNFQFRMPGRPWVQVKEGMLNKDSKVSLLRRSPECYFIIIAENLGGSALSTSEELAELGKAHLQSVASSFRLIIEAEHTVNGLTGVLIKHHAVVSGRDVYYEQWFCMTNGFGYQLMGWGALKDQQRVSAELAQTFPRFEVLDPLRVASASGRSFSTNFVSYRYDYTVDVANSWWRNFSSLKTDFPQAEFGASRGDSCFAVVPVWLRQQPCETEALVAALLATLSIEYPDDGLTNRHAITEGEFTGEQLDFTREVDRTTLRYRFKVLQGRGCAFLVAAWTQRRGANADAVLEEALGRVTFLPAATEPLGSSTPFSTQEIKNQGYVLNQAGLHFFQAGDYQKAQPLFRAAVGINHTNLTYLQNLLLTFGHSEQCQAGLEFLDSVAPDLVAKPEILTFKAYFQSKCNLTAAAMTNYAQAFALGHRDEADLRDYVSLLELQQDFQPAHAVVESYLKAGDSIEARLLLAEIFREENDLPQAIALLKVESEKAPFNGQILKTLGEYCLEADRAGEALDYSLKLIKKNGKSAANHYLKARSELKLKWYREAKTSLEAAAKLAPANEDIRADLAYVSGLLGEGNNSALKIPIAPVELPLALSRIPGTIASGDFVKGYGAHYLRWAQAISFIPRQEYKTTEYMWIQLDDVTGVEAFSTVQLPYDPLGEDVFVNEVEVLDPAGKSLSVGKVADYYVIDDSSDGMASHNKMINIPVAGLAPGCRLSVVVTRRKASRNQAFPFLEHWFSRRYPVLEGGVFIKGQTNALSIHASAPVGLDVLAEGFWWHVTNMPALRWEPRQPPANTFLPMLWISDRAETWTTIASNYLDSISNKLQVDDQLRSQVQNLIAGLPDDQSKVDRLSRYVQTNCTYKAIEFGQRARIPNPPAEVLRNRYGDCKDHAVLLQQMLATSGIAAQLTLVSKTRTLLREQPSLDQFDHMIVYVADPRGGRFVDCTDKGADLTATVPPALADYEVLILDPQGPRIASIPSYPTNASTLEFAHLISLTNTTDLRVRANLTAFGVHASWLRNFLRSYAEADQRLALQREMELSDADFSDFKVESLDDPKLPLRLQYTYTLKKKFRSANHRLQGAVGASFARYYLAASPVSQRVTPFETRLPMTLHSTTTIEVPDGFQVEETPLVMPPLDARFAIASARQRVVGRKLVLDFDFRQEKGNFAAAEYPHYRETMKQVLAILEREICFKAESQ